MKMWIGILTLALLAPLTVGATSARIDISVTKKTVDRSTTGKQEIPRGSTQRTETEVVYTIGVKPRSSRVPGRVLVEWIVLGEAANGNIYTAAKGESAIETQLAKVTEVETDRISLVSRDYALRHSAGSVESKVYGYGVRILDAEDTVIAEKYSGSSAEKKIDWSSRVDKAPDNPGIPRGKKRPRR